MVKKATKENVVELSKEENDGNVENKRLLNRAVSHGVLVKSPPQLESKVKPSKVIKACNNKDIIKKNAIRKNRYLFSFPAVIAPAASGVMGSVEQLDTRNPVFYMDFPQGRMKFLGTIMHSASRYITLSFSKKNVLCEDSFDSIVLFSDWYWVGKKSINPEERRLPLPVELRDIKVHNTFSFTAGAAEEGNKVVATSRGPRADKVNDDEEDMEVDLVSDNDDDDADDDALEDSTPPDNTGKEGEKLASAGRRSSRSTGKRVSYREDNQSDASDAEEEEETKAKESRLPRAKPAQSPEPAEPKSADVKETKSISKTGDTKPSTTQSKLSFPTKSNPSAEATKTKRGSLDKSKTPPKSKSPAAKKTPPSKKKKSDSVVVISDDDEAEPGGSGDSETNSRDRRSEEADRDTWEACTSWKKVLPRKDVKRIMNKARKRDESDGSEFGSEDSEDGEDDDSDFSI